MITIPFQEAIFGVLLSCIAVYVVKSIDSIVNWILRHKTLNKLLVTINVLIFIITIISVMDTNIYKTQHVYKLLKILLTKNP